MEKKYEKNFFVRITRIIFRIIFCIFVIANIFVVAHITGVETDLSWMLKLKIDAKRIADVKTIRRALSDYYKDNGHYPLSSDMCSSWLDANKKVNDNYIPELGNYISKLPHDPEEKKAGCPDYCYRSLPDGSDYDLTYYFNERNNRKSLGKYSSLCGNYIRYDVCGKNEKCPDFNEKLTIQSTPVLKKEISPDEIRLKDMEIIKESLEMYYKDHDSYPKMSVNCSSWVITAENKDINYISDMDSYLSKQPHDPQEKPKSCPDYCYQSDGEKYMLDFFLSKEFIKNNGNNILGKERKDEGECGNFIRFRICGKNEQCLD